MKPLTLVLVLAFAPACTVHVHVHEAPREVAAVGADAAGAQRASQSQPVSVRGIVVDAQGHPRRGARVAVVGASGSMSSGTDENGRFELLSDRFAVTTVHASTEDGDVAVLAVTSTDGDLRLELRPGSRLSLDLAAPESVRCAILDGELRIEDFTLRPGETANVVVPPGVLRVRLYDGDRIHDERRVELSAGDRRALRFELDSSS